MATWLWLKISVAKGLQNWPRLALVGLLTLSHLHFATMRHQPETIWVLRIDLSFGAQRKCYRCFSAFLIRVVPISYKAVVSPFVLVDTLNANLPGMHPNEFGTCDFRSSDSAKSMRKNVLHFFFSTWHQWTCSTSVTLLPRNHSNPNAQQYFCFQISSIAICFPHMWIGEWNLALAGSSEA